MWLTARGPRLRTPEDERAVWGGTDISPMLEVIRNWQFWGTEVLYQSPSPILLIAPPP